MVPAVRLEKLFSHVISFSVKNGRTQVNIQVVVAMTI